MAALDLLFGDYIDAIAAILTILLWLVLIIAPAVLGHLILRSITGPARAVVAVGVVAAAIALSVAYYVRVPRDYAQALAWRQQVYARSPSDDLDDRNVRDTLDHLVRPYPGPDRWRDISPSLHFNVYAMAAVDSRWLVRIADNLPKHGRGVMSPPGKTDDPDYDETDQTLRFIGAIVGIPGMVVRWLIFDLLWSNLLRVSWALCPWTVLGLVGLGHLAPPSLARTSAASDSDD